MLIPFTTPIRTQSEIDRKIWDWQYNPDVEIPTMIILHHSGLIYRKDGYTEEGVTWHLKETGPENNLSDIKLGTHYFPVLGVSRTTAGVDIKEKDIDRLKPWVVNQPYFYKYYENFQKVFVPGICFHIGMYWVWSTASSSENKYYFNRTDRRKHSLIKIQISFSKNYIYNRHTNKTHGIFDHAIFYFL